VTCIGEPLDLTKPERVANAGDDLIPYQLPVLPAVDAEYGRKYVGDMEQTTNHFSSFPTLQHLHL